MRFGISIVLLFLFCEELQAQCTAYLNLGGFSSTLTAEFIAEGAVNPQYIMDWGDGTIDTSYTPYLEHQYASEGFYVLTYTYQDLDTPGCTYTSFDSVIITGGACSLNFNVQTYSLAALVQAFSFNTSLPIYSIDWGDGSPVETAQTGLHAYALPGVYEICVGMYDADPTLPCELNQCQQVEITGDGSSCPVDFQVVTNDLDATASVVAGGGTNAGYFIDWGDSNFDVSPVTEHTYANPGTYQACVYYGLANTADCQSSACVEVVVDPLGDCYFNFVASINGLSVDLDVLAAGADSPLYYFEWGDGTTDEGTQPPSHTYSGAGTYEICGSYSDENNPEGCQLTDCISVTINESSGGCSVDLTVTQTGSDVSIVALGEGAVEPTYFVEWGDGSLPLLASEGLHTYENAGAFEICVTYSDATNEACSATTCETVVVTNVAELASSGAFVVWPNPVKDVMTLELSPAVVHPAYVRIYDATGRFMYNEKIIFNREGRRFALDVASLPSGFYVVSLVTEQGTFEVRVVK